MRMLGGVDPEMRDVEGQNVGVERHTDKRRGIEQGCVFWAVKTGKKQLFLILEWQGCT